MNLKGVVQALASKDVRGSMNARLKTAEDTFSLGILGLMAILPILEILFRLLNTNVPGAAQLVSALTMWIGFAGAMLAARLNQHLSLSTGVGFLPETPRRILEGFATVVAVVVTAVLAYGGWVAMLAELGIVDPYPESLRAWLDAFFSVGKRNTAMLPGGIPTGYVQLIMPIGYAVVAVRLVLAKVSDWPGRALITVTVIGVIAILRSLDIEAMESTDLLLILGLAALLVATTLGAPIYVALGGAALLLFWLDEEPIAAVAAETVRQIKNPLMPTIPLFTFTGYILAESKASERLVRFFRALVGWMPGGMALMTALVCAFFTTFTGASGVTILALGGLLFPVLQKERYPENFSLGLLTASGSIGLLFPPSLPIILYGVTAKVPIDQMFVAGILPGFVLVGAVSLLGVGAGVRSQAPRPRFDRREVLGAAWGAKWELALPFIVVIGYLFGFMTLVEAAAITAAYTPSLSRWWCTATCR